MEPIDTDSLTYSPTSVIQMPVPRRFLFHPHDHGVVWDLNDTKNRILWLYQEHRITQHTYHRIAMALQDLSYSSEVDWNVFIERTDGRGVKALLFWMEDHGVKYNMDPLEYAIETFDWNIELEELE